MFLRKYAEEAIIEGIPLITRDAMDFKASPTLEAGDVKISIDGGAEADLDTLPSVAPAGGTSVKLSLSAEELTGKRAVITLIDQSATKEWEDQKVIVETYGHADAQFPFDPATFATPADLTGAITSGTLLHNYTTQGDPMDYVQGDEKPFTCNAPDGWDFTQNKKVYLCIKKDHDDDDANALINREATVLGPRTAELTPASAETAGASGRYYAEWKQYEADGTKPKAVEQFVINIVRRVRHQ